MASDLDTLAEFGIFSSDGVRRLAELIRNVQQLAGAGMGARRGPGRPRGAGRPGRKPGRPAGSGRKGGRRSRGSFNVSKDALQEMRKTMTGSAIARKHGVSLSTVQNYLRKYGLTSGKRGRPRKS
jgi:hypothetical protein